MILTSGRFGQGKVLRPAKTDSQSKEQSIGKPLLPTGSRLLPSNLNRLRLRLLRLKVLRTMRTPFRSETTNPQRVQIAEVKTILLACADAQDEVIEKLVAECDDFLSD